jgi:hypothetical protein
MGRLRNRAFEFNARNMARWTHGLVETPFRDGIREFRTHLRYQLHYITPHIILLSKADSVCLTSIVWSTGHCSCVSTISVLDVRLVPTHRSWRLACHMAAALSLSRLQLVL